MNQMQATRNNMSDVRLNFIKTLDKHTQMELVRSMEMNLCLAMQFHFV